MGGAGGHMGHNARSLGGGVDLLRFSIGVIVNAQLLGKIGSFSASFSFRELPSDPGLYRTRGNQRKERAHRGGFIRRGLVDRTHAPLTSFFWYFADFLLRSMNIWPADAAI